MLGVMSILVVVVIFMVVVGMLVHMVAFGSAFWLIARKVTDAAEAQRPKPCSFCGGTLLPDATACNTCGAPRDPKQVGVRSFPQDTRP